MVGLLPLRAGVGMSCPKVQCAHCIWVFLGRVCELGKQLAHSGCVGQETLRAISLVQRWQCSLVAEGKPLQTMQCDQVGVNGVDPCSGLPPMRPWVM